MAKNASNAAPVDAATQLSELLAKQKELQDQMSAVQEQAKASILAMDALATPYNEAIQKELDAANQFSSGYKPLIDEAKAARDKVVNAAQAEFKAATDDAYKALDEARTATEAAVEAIRTQAVSEQGEVILVVLKGTKVAAPHKTRSGQQSGRKRVSLDAIGPCTVDVTAPKDTGKSEPITVRYRIHTNDAGELVITGTHGDVSHTGSITKAARYAGWHNVADVSWALAQMRGLDVPELSPANDPSFISFAEVAD